MKEKIDSYGSLGAKILDFIIGFVLGILTLLSLSEYFPMVLDFFWDWNGKIVNIFIIVIILILIRMIFRKRRYIFVGIISAFLIPMLILGACTLL